MRGGEGERKGRREKRIQEDSKKLALMSLHGREAWMIVNNRCAADDKRLVTCAIFYNTLLLLLLLRMTISVDVVINFTVFYPSA